MDDTGKDLIILLVLAEVNDYRTAKQISALTATYQAPVSVTDAAGRLPHLMVRGYVIQGLNNALQWAVTPAGIKWAAQNRKK